MGGLWAAFNRRRTEFSLNLIFGDFAAVDAALKPAHQTFLCDFERMGQTDGYKHLKIL